MTRAFHKYVVLDFAVALSVSRQIDCLCCQGDLCSSGQRRGDLRSPGQQRGGVATYPRRADGAPRLPRGRPVEGATSWARGTSGEAVGRGRRAAPPPSCRGDLCLPGHRRGGVATGPRRPDDAFYPPREAASSTAPRSGPVGRAERRLAAVGGRRQLRAVGSTSARPGSGGVAPRLGPGAPMTSTTPREAALSTALRSGPVGRAGRRPDVTGGGWLSRAARATSAHLGGDGARPSSARGVPASPRGPTETTPSTAKRAAAARRARQRCAVPERPRRLASTGGSSWGRGANTADPRAASTATPSGRPVREAATRLGGRARATAARGEGRRRRAWRGSGAIVLTGSGRLPHVPQGTVRGGSVLQEVSLEYSQVEENKTWSERQLVLFLDRTSFQHFLSAGFISVPS